MWAGVSGLATMVGLFFGGLLTQEFGWRWVFFVNLPLCALLLIFTLVNPPPHQKPNKPGPQPVTGHGNTGPPACDVTGV